METDLAEVKTEFKERAADLASEQKEVLDLEKRRVEKQIEEDWLKEKEKLK